MDAEDRRIGPPPAPTERGASGRLLTLQNSLSESATLDATKAAAASAKRRYSNSYFSPPHVAHPKAPLVGEGLARINRRTSECYLILSELILP